MKKTQRKNNGWLKLDKALLRVTTVTNNQTGVVVGWSLEHTVLWLYMHDRYEFFHSKRQEFYDNLQDIADNVGMSLRTLTRKLKDFTDLGLVSITKKKLPHHVGYQKSNKYVVESLVGSMLFSTDVPVEATQKKAQKNNIWEEEKCPF